MIRKFDKIFSAIGEQTRLKIIKLLSVEKLCVCELAAVLDMRQPRISQHLRILKEADLVTENKEGYWTYYRLNKAQVDEVFGNFLEFLAADLGDLNEFETERLNLSNLESNPAVNETKNLLSKEKIKF